MVLADSRSFVFAILFLHKLPLIVLYIRKNRERACEKWLSRGYGDEKK